MASTASENGTPNRSVTGPFGSGARPTVTGAATLATLATLVAGDAAWAVPGVNYGTGLRRMEWPGNDTITFTLPGSISILCSLRRLSPTSYASMSFTNRVTLV